YLKVLHTKFPQFKEDGEVKGLEYKIIKKDGTRAMISFNGKISYDENMNFKQTHGIFQDITERKKTEQTLKESEKKYRDLFENSPSSIILVDLDGKIVDCNSASEFLTGYNKADLLNHNVSNLELFFEDSLDLIKKNFKLLIDGEEANQLEVKSKTKNGKIIWIVIIASLISIAERKYIQAILHDITEIKKIERELNEISQLKSELLERTSHELKTPIISIKGFTELLLELHKEKFDTETILILDEIKDGTLRLQTVINKLLESSLLDSGKTHFEPSQEDLSFLIRFCVKNLRGLAKTRNIFVNLDIANKIILNFEKERIYEVITHLIINAIKYTPPYGEIKIQTKNKGTNVIVSVQDNGIGLSVDERRKLFKQFGKIERYGQGWDIGIEGTGMGLFTSKKIVELHGGKIWVESEGRNRGSTFYFSLPGKKD
ncbi:MAG: Signal transduction histidine kinase, partial [Candidatus Lokiarchaeum sp. GC14_75]